MKIAYLSNTRFPNERAHSIQIAQMCQAFSFQSENTTLVVNTRSSATSREVDDFFKINTNFKIIRIPYGIFMPKVRVSFYVSEFIFSISFLLGRKIDDCDIIYTRNEWVASILSLIIPARKIIWESHEAKFTYSVRLLFKKGIKVVVISEGIRDFYLRKGICKNLLHVAHDGIDDSFFEKVATKVVSRETLGIPIHAKVAMYIGGLDKWKGAETFFQSRKLLPGVTCVVVGGHEDEIDKYKKIYPDVLFLGSRPYHELKHIQQAADVLVLPNTAKNELSEKYTSPLKLFSYMASGVPMVTSDIESIRNVLSKNVTTYVKPDSAKDLANGIQIVLSNYSAALERAALCKEQALEYTWSNRAKKIINFIEM